jgi:hypothetical protein
LGVAIELTPSVSFEFGQENNNTMDAKSYGKLTVKIYRSVISLLKDLQEQGST